MSEKSPAFGYGYVALLAATLVLAVVLGRGAFGELNPSTPRIWAYLFGYLFVLWPSGFIIERVLPRMVKIRNPKEGLENAGKWIGYLERFLILTFVFGGSYVAVALLVAAKSILRYPEVQENSEYVLIGTLLSFSIAVAVGLLV